MADHEFRPDFCNRDVHNGFGLSYGNYLVWPRSLMEAMPAEWQHQFKALWDQFSDAYPAAELTYEVRARNERRQYVIDPLREYRHPDRAAIEQARGKDS